MASATPWPTWWQLSVLLTNVNRSAAARTN